MNCLVNKKIILSDFWTKNAEVGLINIFLFLTVYLASYWANNLNCNSVPCKGSYIFHQNNIIA